MTREQFNRLLRHPSKIDLNFISDLEEITRRFPYFTNAHILLAKQYHGHENIKYESHLRKASAYAPDRTLLYNLIKQEPDEVIHIPSPKQSEELSQAEAITPAKSTTFSETKIVSEIPKAPDDIVQVAESHEPETLVQDELKSNVLAQEPVTEPDTILRPTSQPVSPLEVIEQRLRELEIKNNSDKEPIADAGLSLPEVKSISPLPGSESEIGEEELKEPAESERLPINDKESIDLKAVRSDKAGEKSADSSNLIEPKPSITEKPSPPARPEKAEESVSSKTIKDIPITHSFSEWLKIKSIPVIAAENIGAYLLKDSDSDFDNQALDYQPDLIDKFIKSEPRIVAGKSEFYSPGNMARRSAIDHEDLISETLARIYAQQGNILKAIDAYQRLSLKNPEKITYFAALIKELEDRPEG
jgi:hypothetical protein